MMGFLFGTYVICNLFRTGKTVGWSSPFFTLRRLLVACLNVLSTAQLWLHISQLCRRSQNLLPPCSGCNGNLPHVIYHSGQGQSPKLAAPPSLAAAKVNGRLGRGRGVSLATPSSTAWGSVMQVNEGDLPLTFFLHAALMTAYSLPWSDTSLWTLWEGDRPPWWRGEREYQNFHDYHWFEQGLQYYPY